jgi:hypothetical protein
MVEVVKYWDHDSAENVHTEPVWMNPKLIYWVLENYSSPENFRECFSRVVTLNPRNVQLKHHPTGGRAAIYDLPTPFYDPQTGLPCIEADVKGVSLTTAGYSLYARELTGPRREIMIHNGRQEVFGLQSLAGIKADKHNTLQVANHGIETPVPAAILRLNEIIFKGQKYKTSQLASLLPINPEEIGLYIRFWPGTSTRVSDLYQWGNTLRLPTLTEMSSTKIQNEQKHAIQTAKQRWNHIEKNRLQSSLAKFMLSDNDLFSYCVTQFADQLNRMLELELSPSTGEESESNNLHHTSFHNWTPIGIAVEWTPITSFKKLQPPHQYRHIKRLANDIHSAVVALGAAASTNFNEIPTFYEFLCQALDQSQSASTHLRHLLETYSPLNADGQRCITFVGESDHFVDWLRANQ